MQPISFKNLTTLFVVAVAELTALSYLAGALPIVDDMMESFGMGGFMDNIPMVG